MAKGAIMYIERFFLLIFLLLLWASPTFAKNYDMKNDYQIVLGQGWDAINPNDNKVIGQCFSSNQAFLTGSNTPTLGSVDVRSDFIEKASEFERVTKTDFSFSASGSYSGFSGDLSSTLSTVNSSFLDDRTVVWALTIERTYTPSIATSLNLTPSAKTILTSAQASNNYSPLFSKCGSSAITQIVRGSSISVVYFFRASSAEKASSVKSAISASVSYAGANVDVSSSFSESVRAADSNVSMSVRVFQRGASADLATIESIALASPGDLAAIRTGLQPVLNAQTYNSSEILRFSETSISPQFGIPAALDPTNFHPIINGQLEQLKSARLRFEKRKALLNAMLDGQSSGEVILKDGAVETIETEIQKIDEDLSKLLIKEISCRVSGVLNDCTFSFNFGASPSVVGLSNEKYISFLGWSLGKRSTTGGTYSYHYITPEAQFALTNAPLIKEIRLFRDGEVHVTKISENLRALNGTSLVMGGSSLHEVISQRCPRNNHNPGYKTTCSWKFAAREQAHRPALVAKHKSRSYYAEVVDIDGKVSRVDIEP